jgi:hypothetical protein
VRLGIFWLGKIEREIEAAIASLCRDVRRECFEGVHIFTPTPHESSVQFKRATALYPYDTINDLQDVYHHSRERNIDFAVISFGNGIPLSLESLHGLLSSERVQRAIWSFRICRVVGHGFRHSPRFPLIDYHFIVLNITRATEKSYFERRLVNSSHFSAGGGRHAHLLSMVEYSLGKEEYNNHWEPLHSKDCFGHVCEYNPFPFHICELTGFLVIYSNFKSSLFDVLVRNLSLDPPGRYKWSRQLIYKGDGKFCYLRCVWNIKPVMGLLKRLFSTERFSFRKNYDRDF